MTQTAAVGARWRCLQSHIAIGTAPLRNLTGDVDQLRLMDDFTDDLVSELRLRGQGVSLQRLAAQSAVASGTNETVEPNNRYLVGGSAQRGTIRMLRVNVPDNRLHDLRVPLGGATLRVQPATASASTGDDYPPDFAGTSRAAAATRSSPRALASGVELEVNERPSKAATGRQPPTLVATWRPLHYPSIPGLLMYIAVK